MNDKPYAIIVQPGVTASGATVSERTLAYHDGGADRPALTPSLTVESSTVTPSGVGSSDVLTVTMSRPLKVEGSGVACVGVACKPSELHKTFEPDELA